jgi:hypothetical protein
MPTGAEQHACAAPLVVDVAARLPELRVLDAHAQRASWGLLGVARCLTASGA